MKIITWNCNMAFRKKANFVLMQKPDILIVQECECTDKLLFSNDTPTPTDVLWFGKNKNKGIALFSYSNFRFTLLDNYNQDLQMIIPVAVTNGDFEFYLLAIWANNPADRDGQYVEQVWKAIHFYQKILKGKPTILAGDFNSNTIWDRKKRAGNHSNVVKFLEKRRIFSTYHLYYKQIQGTEEHPTLFLYRHKDKPYHIDYCFASKDLLDKLSSVEIGAFEDWVMYSDHVPVMVSFAL